MAGRCCLISRQGQLAGMHDRAGGHRGLPTAVGAPVGEGFGLKQPSAAPAAAARADKAFWPTALEKVLRARAFRRKAALKFNQRPRKPSLRSRHDNHPAHPKRMSKFTPVFLFRTLNSGSPGTLVHKP